MAKLYNKTPAEILFVDDPYTAFCLNEACAIIRIKVENNEEPIFQVKAEEKVKTEYKSFTDMYKKYTKRK